jgi:pyruvate formate lyase activating enzyme
MNTEAQWYLPLSDKTVQCTLCPHNCILKEGKSGLCRVRVNQRGKLITEVNGFVSSINFDPIEKKPLFHFYPGSAILSLGTYGCNLRCFFCQNCTISQTAARPELTHSFYSPEQIIQIALKRPENIGIAFTYNEPVVWYEYMYDIARLAKKAGLKTVMVTNGYINKDPLNSLLEYMDAFSVDLKAFSEEFYTKVTSSELEPVKETLRRISLAGKHLEVVNLVIPELNDDEENFESMVRWIANHLGRNTVLHISRYYPNYKLSTDATPISLIRRLKSLAEKELNYVYSGNTHAESNDTQCANCNNVLISRESYAVSLIGIDTEGKCIKCGNYFLKKT